MKLNGVKRMGTVIFAPSARILGSYCAASSAGKDFIWPALAWKAALIVNHGFATIVAKTRCAVSTARSLDATNRMLTDVR